MENIINLVIKIVFVERFVVSKLIGGLIDVYEFVNSISDLNIIKFYNLGVI